MTKNEALKLALEFVENSEGGTADLEAHIKEALAQRTWVGLTNEERNEFLYLTVTKGAIDFAKACEAKLKEKNT